MKKPDSIYDENGKQIYTPNSFRRIPDSYTPKFKVGDKVVFNGQTKEQQNWGGNSDASHLIVGREYIVEGVVTHSWHTKLMLRYVTGKFNSVCFSLVGSEL